MDYWNGKPVSELSNQHLNNAIHYCIKNNPNYNSDPRVNKLIRERKRRRQLSKLIRERKRRRQLKRYKS